MKFSAVIDVAVIAVVASLVMVDAKLVLHSHASQSDNVPAPKVHRILRTTCLAKTRKDIK
jgi:hypothetical protein